MIAHEFLEKVIRKLPPEPEMAGSLVSGWMETNELRLKLNMLRMFDIFVTSQVLSPACMNLETIIYILGKSDFLLSSNWVMKKT